MFQFRFPIFNGGYYYGHDGKLKQFRMWWPITFARYVDWFWRTLIGKEGLSFDSTRISVNISGNTHQPKGANINITMVDQDNPKLGIWGMHLNPDQARQLAVDLIDLAEKLNPKFSTREFQEENYRFLQKQLEGEN